MGPPAAACLTCPHLLGGIWCHSLVTITTAPVQVLERKKLLSQAANAGLLSRADKAGLSLAKVVVAHAFINCSIPKPRAGLAQCITFMYA